MNKIKLLMAIAAAIHAASFALTLQGIEPIARNFYSIAWWTYILFLSGLNHLRARNSLLFDTPREFLWIFLYSTPAWLLFEVYNFRLNNWSYIGLPAETYLRWPGYVISFGTVLPGIFETETCLKNFGVATRLQGRSIRITRGLLLRLFAAGLLMMILPLVRPSLLFPLLWIGVVFLLDPIIYWRSKQTRSLLGNAERGHYSLIVRFLITGIVCGFLWEFWNYWASAKWLYTIPYLDFWPVFEMPILGFLGFAPFALECYLLHQAFLLFRERVVRGQTFLATITTALLFIYCLLAFLGIDHWTVEAYRAAN